jgi:glycosyltransferase involved in cell wall biosynthesis
MVLGHAVSPVRVVLLIDELEVRGGTENHLLDLLSGLHRDRVAPTVIVLALAGLLPEVAAMGIPTEALRIRHLLGPDGLKTLVRLVVSFRRIRPHLVVTYHPGADLVGPIAARAVGARVISCRRDLGFTRTPKHRMLQRPMNRLIHGMIGVSSAVQRAVVEAEGFPAEKIRVIPNGCDMDVYQATEPTLRRELGIGDDEVVVGTLSNFGKIKGYDVMVPAALEVLKNRPGVRFVFVGKDEAGEDEVSRWKAECKPAGDRILFAGSRRDVPHVLSSFDVFLQASHSEGFSNSILQAMACGRPVVATDVGGNRELVDEASGFLVPAGDRAAVVRGLEALVGDRERRLAAGKAARERAASTFSKARMVERYEDTFEYFAGVGRS